MNRPAGSERAQLLAILTKSGVPLLKAGKACIDT